uniref:CRAL-TRIO domain-containing protein n=2 Tax=Ditylum brightwellii TaxID=49249 RepID=A0A7S2A240_9STRA
MTVAACLTNEEKEKKMKSATESSQRKRETEDETKQVMPLPIESPDSMHKLEWLDDVLFDNTDLQKLETLQPESTLGERRRFLKARKHCVKAASAQLGTYLQWRDDNRLEEFFPSTFTTDVGDWMSAARGALEIANESGHHVNPPKLPRLVSVFEGKDFVVCKNGARVIHVLPCQLDSNLAAPSTYALAVAMYLDRKLDRNCTEKVTVVIDIRFGKGWTNPSSVSIVPFIKLVVGLLNTYFPERLSRCILFPLPRAATMLFNTAKSYLDPDTAAKIQVCSGAGSIDAPVPDKVSNFIDRHAIDIMEQRRKSFFL